MILNLFKKVGIDSHDGYSPVVSDGNQFFVLDLMGDGSYGTCTEVSDETGFFKGNDDNIKDFVAVYEKKIHSNEYELIGYRIY